jgi:hypothetical protein
MGVSVATEDGLEIIDTEEEHVRFFRRRRDGDGETGEKE